MFFFLPGVPRSLLGQGVVNHLVTGVEPDDPISVPEEVMHRIRNMLSTDQQTIGYTYLTPISQLEPDSAFMQELCDRLGVRGCEPEHAVGQAVIRETDAMVRPRWCICCVMSHVSYTHAYNLRCITCLLYRLGHLGAPSPMVDHVPLSPLHLRTFVHRC